MDYNRAVVQRPDTMYRTSFHRGAIAGGAIARGTGVLGVLLSCALLCIGVSSGQESSGARAPSAVAIKAVAEVEVRKVEHGRETPKLVPADRVASGDWLIYTLEVRNTRPMTIPPPTVIYAVPEHTTYVADSAVGPATKVSYSVDGGRSFDVPENLKVQAPGGPPHLAAASDYTHIRWQLKNGLKGNSVAFVRFRARAK
jgi:uncharacterized repeat protein (TIGR01451 family)